MAVSFIDGGNGSNRKEKLPRLFFHFSDVVRSSLPHYRWELIDWLVDWLIDWLMSSANISSFSAISWARINWVIDLWLTPTFTVSQLYCEWELNSSAKWWNKLCTIRSWPRRSVPSIRMEANIPITVHSSTYYSSFRYYYTYNLYIYIKIEYRIQMSYSQFKQTNRRQKCCTINVCGIYEC
jgi:hypothetical protein